MASVDVEKQTLNVGGLLTDVYSRPGLRAGPASKPIVALIFLHGRQGSADDAEPTAREAFARASARAAATGQTPREFIIVAIDQRNHGRRLVDALGNEGWNLEDPKVHNERHAVDMYSILLGAVKDVSFLIDVLPAYVFPHDERVVAEWALAGVSLGGHATWLALRHEPRIRIGVPIIGCPDYLALMDSRAAGLGVPRAPPYFPGALRTLVRARDAAYAPEALRGKRVLVLSGKDDVLVPWAASASFVDALDVGEKGRKEVQLLEGVGHAYPDAMREELIRFFWEEALVGELGGLSAL
ncbi:Alpha/Beta hydrolase protein [Gloeopeniophorella convolvens]|nr:Alpha/Beta hydrolase protein [Gloeopeniophorella convolvens]